MIDDLLRYVQEKERVCPKPVFWNELWEMLPNRKKAGVGWNPPAPLVLAAWLDTPASLKIARLREHIRYAHRQGVLEKTERYLRGLEDNQWAYRNDFRGL